ncbi:MAG TPA: cupin domain-containing protein [Methylomirabilota bacterium]|nr:cupin domain-containing protein [Methylomirabilota bacterium]
MRNLFDDLPDRLPGERVDVIVDAPGVRIERIVSTGHMTPPDEWYDQDADEWVVVLRGRARVRLEGEPEARDLYPGDHLLLRARVRHRVEWTDDSGPTVWLAVHHH